MIAEAIFIIVVLGAWIAFVAFICSTAVADIIVEEIRKLKVEEDE